MAGDTQITIVGNMVDDCELRFTPSGSAVANFTIASTPRSFDAQSKEWKDGETLFMRCSIWREAAENVAETLKKGMRVIAEGRLKSRSYDDKQGQKRTVMEMEVDEIGPSLRYATATVVRTQRNSQQGGQNQWSGQQQGGGQQYAGQQGGYQQAGAPQQGGYGQQQGGQDPWATPGPQQGGNPGQWGNGPGQEPPF